MEQGHSCPCFCGLSMEGQECPSSLFTLESTISGKAQVGLVREAAAAGYKVVIHFLWLPSVKEAIAPVRQRVRKGGHDVPVPDIRRRYPRLLENLVGLYLPVADEWYFWNSQSLPPVPLANSGTHAIADVEEFLHLR